MTTLRDLDDKALIDTLGVLARNEREATAELVACLAEVDRRKLYAERGYSSLFEYCQKVLHMAEPSIYVRIGAARCSRRFPLVLQMLRAGQLHLSAIKLLAPHLTEDNQASLLAAARNQSKREVEKLIKDLAPQPDAKETVRKLPARKDAKEAAMPLPTQAAAPQTQAPKAVLSVESKQTPAAMSAGDEPVRRPEPLGLGRYKVQFTASEKLQRKIQQAQDLLRHKNLTGDLATLFEAAIDQLIAAENKRQHGATERPRAVKQEPSEQNKQSRRIPNDVKRTVFDRDGGQCTFVSPDGRRCTERGGLQYHHEIPFAKGGPNTTENVRLLCRCHNALHARRDYGEQHVAARIGKARKQEPSPRSSTRTAAVNGPGLAAMATKTNAQVPLAFGVV